MPMNENLSLGTLCYCRRSTGSYIAHNTSARETIAFDSIFKGATATFRDLTGCTCVSF